MDDTCGTVPDYGQNSEVNSGYYPPCASHDAWLPLYGNS